MAYALLKLGCSQEQPLTSNADGSPSEDWRSLPDGCSGPDSPAPAAVRQRAAYRTFV